MLTLDLLRTKRNLLFWTLHGAGWSAYAITQYFGALLYEKPASYGQVILIAALAGFVLSMPMRSIYRRLWGRSPRVFVFGVLLTCYGTALALRTVINLSYKQFVEPDYEFKTLFELFAGALSTTYLLLCWSALYFSIKHYEAQQMQQAAALKAAALAQEAQLKNSDSRQSEPYREQRRNAPVGIPALHLGPGPGKKGDTAPGNRSVGFVPGNGAAALR